MLPGLVIWFVDDPPPWPVPEPVPDRRNRAAPRLTFRPVNAAGAYPDWLRKLRASAGAYVIRDRGGDVLYVGESEGGRLYGTITRHFQRWRRDPKPNPYSAYRRPDSDNDPGTTYDRRTSEVAIVLTRPDRAISTQNELIRTLAPRDNKQGQLPIEELEDAPF